MRVKCKKNILSILVSLDGTTANCDLEDYPANSNYLDAVTYNNGEVLACGGRDDEHKNRCWSFNGSAWSALPNFKQNHCGYHSNVLVNEGWWVTGNEVTGQLLEEYDDFLQETFEEVSYSCTDSPTSEVYNGKAWIPGPTLPGVEYPWSCVVSLNTTHTFLIGGGVLYTLTTDAWLYDWTSQAWTRTGTFIKRRSAHNCVSLGGQGILVVGGYGFDGYNSYGFTPDNWIYTVELFDPDRGTWSFQPDIPRDIKPGVPILLNWDDQVLALFDKENQIYKRSEENGEWSVLGVVRLPSDFGGYYDKAVLVPDNWSCNPAQ